MKRELTTKMVDMIVELREQGMFSSKIASEVGCSRRTVYRYLEERQVL